MKTISMNELKQNIDSILINVASGNEYVKVRVGKEISAIIIDEAEWKIMCDAFALLTGGKKIEK